MVRWIDKDSYCWIKPSTLKATLPGRVGIFLQTVNVFLCFCVEKIQKNPLFSSPNKIKEGKKDFAAARLATILATRWKQLFEVWPPKPTLQGEGRIEFVLIHQLQECGTPLSFEWF